MTHGLVTRALSWNTGGVWRGAGVGSGLFLLSLENTRRKFWFYQIRLAVVGWIWPVITACVLSLVLTAHIFYDSFKAFVFSAFLYIPSSLQNCQLQVQQWGITLFCFLKKKQSLSEMSYFFYFVILWISQHNWYW